MPVTVYVPVPLRPYTGYRARVQIDSAGVGHLLDTLEAGFPGLRGCIRDPRGHLRRRIHLYVNGRPISPGTAIAAPLREGDEVALLPAIAGGASGFSEEQVRRYSRHIILPEVGGTGQKRLLSSRVLLVGAGGLGSPVALYLGAAGVGTLGIVDFDAVDISNLQRQVIHGGRDIGRPKVLSAAEKVREMNPDVQVIPHEMRLSSAEALDLFAEYDVVVDASDNFPTRYLANDASVLAGKPLVHGSIYRFDGQATVFAPGQGCYRCLFPMPPPPGTVPSCAEAGVLGVLPGVIGTIQAAETIKVLLGIGRTLVGRLLIFDALAMDFREVQLRRNPACPVCGDKPTIQGLIDYEEFCGLRAPATGEPPRTGGNR